VEVATASVKKINLPLKQQTVFASIGLSSNTEQQPKLSKSGASTTVHPNNRYANKNGDSSHHHDHAGHGNSTSLSRLSDVSSKSKQAVQFILSKTLPQIPLVGNSAASLKLYKEQS
jgi:hypothetical protein